MAIVKCFIRIVGGRTYVVIVRDATETADGPECSYEQFMASLKQEEELRHIVNGQFEIWDEDLGGYVVLGKNTPIANKAKLQVNIQDRQNNGTQSPNVRGATADTPPASDSIGNSELNDAQETAQLMEKLLIDDDIGEILDSDLDSIPGHTDLVVEDDDNSDDDGESSFKDEKEEQINGPPAGDKRHGHESGPRTSNATSSSQNGLKKSKSLENILKKKSPAFCIAHEEFNKRDPWYKKFEAKLLTYMYRNFDKLVKMHYEQKKTPTQVWSSIISNIDFPEEDGQKMTVELSKKLFNESLEYYLDVQLNSKSYRESFKLYPNGFEMFSKFIARRSLLLALGIDDPRIIVIITATEGYNRPLVQKLRDEYKKWKDTGNDDELKTIRQFMDKKEKKRANGSGDAVPESSGTKTQANGLASGSSSRAVNISSPSIKESAKEKKGTLPPQVWSIIRGMPQQFIDMMDRLWSRPRDKWELEEALFSFLATACPKTATKNAAVSWARDENLPSKEFWERVAQQMRLSLSNPYIQPSYTMNDCWNAFNESLDYYIQLCLHVRNDNDRITCYPCVPQSMKQIRITFSMGMDRKRIGIILAFEKNIRPDIIRQFIAERQKLNDELGIKGYLMTEGKNSSTGAVPKSRGPTMVKGKYQGSVDNLYKEYFDDRPSSRLNSTLNDDDDLWSESGSVASNVAALRDPEMILSGKREHFKRKMVNYQNLPQSEVIKHTAFLKYFNDRRNSIAAQPLAHDSEARRRIWEEASQHLSSRYPNAFEFKTSCDCKKMFRRLMLDALVVRANCRTDGERYSVWKFYKLCARLSHNRFLKNMGITDGFYEAMKSASGHGGIAVDPTQLEELLNGSKVSQLKDTFFKDGLDEDEAALRDESASSSSSQAKYTEGFMSDMNALKNQSAGEKAAQERLITHFIQKRDAYLSLVDGSDSTDEIVNALWKKITEFMNAETFPPRHCSYYKNDLLNKILDIYESILHNVKTKAEAIKFWPKSFELMHEKIVHENFLLKVCQVEEQRVKRLVIAKNKSNY